MEQTQTSYNPLKCPFTDKELMLVSRQELDIINSKIQSEELTFYTGVAVRSEVEKAYTTSQNLYIFPVFDGITFLKKETAIVAKNRTANPLLRLSPKDQQRFNARYGFGTEEKVYRTDAQVLEHTELKIFRDELPKNANVVLTSNAETADDVLNLVFEKKIGMHFHVDHNLFRLKKVRESLSDRVDTLLVDIDLLAFASKSVDVIANFEAVDLLDKVDQIKLYEQSKDVLNADGVLISAYCSYKNFYVKKRLKADMKMVKALSMLAPWKKTQIPKMYFFEVGGDEPSSKTKGSYTQTSLSRQFS